MKYTTSDIKNGLKILVDGDPCVILENEFEKPGKGQAFTRIKFRNYRTGKVLEKTYKSGASLLPADIQEQTMTFLYQENELFHFMDSETYEQTTIDSSVLGNTQKWMIEQATYQILLWNGIPISVTAENFIEIEVTECEPGVKGDTVSGAMKMATIATGTDIKVPLFIKKGDHIKVDTRDGSYVSRV